LASLQLGHDVFKAFNTRPLLHSRLQISKFLGRDFGNQTQPGMARVQALAGISRSRYVAITTQPVHRLQIRRIVHN